MYRTLFLGGILLFMVGCSAVPESLQTASDKPITNVQSLIATPELMQGQEVRLGGVIASIKNEENQTRLEISAMPLTSDGRPVLGAKPQGRFIAYENGFLEPMEYAPGRLVSVVGHFRGMEKGKVGEFDYNFPVIDTTGDQIWQVHQEVRIDDVYPPCFGRYCHRYWRNYPYRGPMRGQVIQRVTP
ncbi:TPA: Slp family lipoprotein [Photobacterium damselae]